MCKFCDSGYNDVEYEFLFKTYKKKVYDVYLWNFTDEKRSCIWIHPNCNTKMPGIVIPIKYCPYCGEKLKRKKW